MNFLNSIYKFRCQKYVKKGTWKWQKNLPWDFKKCTGSLHLPLLLICGFLRNELLFIAQVMSYFSHTVWDTIYYHEIRDNFCKWRDRQWNLISVTLVATVTEDDMLSSAQFTDKLSKMFLPSIRLSI